MSDASRWKIPAGASDWECGWDGDQRFHLQYFRALPLHEKIRAIEEMGQVAAFLAAAGRRRRALPFDNGGRGGCDVRGTMADKDAE